MSKSHGMGRKGGWRRGSIGCVWKYKCREEEGVMNENCVEKKRRRERNNGGKGNRDK